MRKSAGTPEFVSKPVIYRIFQFSLSGPKASIKYVNELGQLSNAEPTWIYFSFWEDPERKMLASTSKSRPSNKRGVEYHGPELDVTYTNLEVQRPEEIIINAKPIAGR